MKFLYLILEHVLDQDLDDVPNIDHEVVAAIDGWFQCFNF